MSEGILGDDMFIEKVQEEIGSDENNEQYAIDLKTLISVIKDRYDVDPEMLQTPTRARRISHIRAITALLARNVKGVSLRELEIFYGLADSSMSQAAKRLEARMSTSEILKKEIKNLKEELLLVAVRGEKL
jgi:chromosomal replication initiation ATPase DnaA